MKREHRVAGTIIGAVVGDALGAPFEFGPPGAYGRLFPTDARGVRTEMCGGGSLGWKPGEFTDDTQMALLLASSIVERGGLDEADVFDRFRTWVAAGPPDVGNQTHSVLSSSRPWDVAADEHFARTGHAAGNGSLMRTTPAALWFSPTGRGATMDAARRISALTHGDPAAGEGCAIFHELVRVAPGRWRSACCAACRVGRRCGGAPREVGGSPFADLAAPGCDRDELRRVADPRIGGLGPSRG